MIDRRRLVLVTELLLMAAAAGLALNASLRHPSVLVIFVVEVIAAAAWSLQRPALDALLPRLVERDELTAAGALSTFQTMTGLLAGPAIGDGLRYARSRPELLGTYTVDIVAMFPGMPQALYPQIARSFGGAGVLGLLYSAPAAGALLASATSGWASHVDRHGRAVVLAAVVWGSGRSRSASAARSGSRSSAWPSRAGPMRSAASSAAGSGTRRSPTSCAAALRASR